MSQESFREFCKAVNENSTIKESMRLLREKYPQGRMSPEDTYKFIVDGMIPLAKKYNFDFNFNDYINYQMKEESGSLSDEDLFGVTGGVFSLRSIGAASALSLTVLGAGAGIAGMAANSRVPMMASQSASVGQTAETGVGKEAKETSQETQKEQHKSKKSSKQKEVDQEKEVGQEKSQGLKQVFGGGSSNFGRKTDASSPSRQERKRKVKANVGSQEVDTKKQNDGVDDAVVEVQESLVDNVDTSLSDGKDQSSINNSPTSSPEIHSEGQQLSNDGADDAAAEAQESLADNVDTSLSDGKDQSSINNSPTSSSTIHSEGQQLSGEGIVDNFLSLDNIDVNLIDLKGSTNDNPSEGEEIDEIICEYYKDGGQGNILNFFEDKGSKLEGEQAKQVEGKKALLELVEPNGAGLAELARDSKEVFLKIMNSQDKSGAEEVYKTHKTAKHGTNISQDPFASLVDWSSTK